ncbi:MAG: hypothetical protein GF388_05945 [Candidatus Aegiribacteria sp.]|nr:hypothetical protein [Candidatus Aegiribacteria sp.]MBD3294723.1 hypothetical protein [Candidatus Fermentibacteria bacterium]
MRILIASSGTIPGYSGGWTTTLDLLGDEHSPMYLISGARAGMHRMEGVPYFGLGLGVQGSEGRILPRRMTAFLKRALEPAAVRWAFRKFRADFVLCLDEFIGTSVKKTGLPYAMRFHRKIEPSFAGPPLRKLLDTALFATASPGTDVPGVEVIPHNQDLSRFDFSPPEKPERALLLTCINDVHEPDLFIRGICLSRHLKGDIVGTGPARRRIESECRKTGGRVRCLPPVPRLKVGELSGKYQIGVATIIRRDKVVYQMKINMYLACGMHTLVKPYTHIVREAPHLVDTFSTPEELASGVDRIFREWRELESRRREARDWVMKNYSVEIPRKRFRELLVETLGYRGGD